MTGILVMYEAFLVVLYGFIVLLIVFLGWALVLVISP